MTDPRDRTYADTVATVGGPVAKTQVVNIKTDDYDVYMGRAHGDLPESPFANPFIIGKDGTREQCIHLYRQNLILRLRRDSRLRRKFLSLKGKRLGCHCAPKPCHCDVVVDLLEGPLGRHFSRKKIVQ